jgi:hypothetical protein
MSLKMAQKISLNEYRQQSKDYTRKALEELNQQLKVIPMITKKLEASIKEEDEDEMREPMTIVELNRKISELEARVHKEETACHYLKLDLSNAKCDLETANQALTNCDLFVKSAASYSQVICLFCCLFVFATCGSLFLVPYMGFYVSYVINVLSFAFNFVTVKLVLDFRKQTIALIKTDD